MSTDGALVALGWDDEVAARWAEAGSTAPGTDELVPARVAQTDRGEVTLLTGPSTTLRATATKAAKDTVAGDWVGVRAGEDRVEAILPRRSAFVRRAARGARRAQTLAANMDVVVVVQGLEPGLNVRRLERELVLAHESRATPVVVLTKLDLVDPADALEAAARAAVGVEVVAVSNVTGDGIDQLRSILGRHTTVAFLGASGVGKSTLVNSLAGTSVQLEGEVRSGDHKGRHTTTAARLIVLGDLLVIDTPGVRALAVWEIDHGLALTFPEIERIGEGCRFADCSHRDEPGCAVIAAVATGEVDPARLAHWNQLLDEAEELGPDY
jgi:ribosome biogenesis GTPase